MAKATDPHGTDDVADDLLTLEAQLCFPVTVAARLLVQAYRPVLEPMGLTHPQYLVMLALWEHDRATRTADEPDESNDHRLTAAELADQLSMEPATLTGLLTRLGEHGLVVRERDARDDRRKLVRLTERGRALRTQAESVPRQMISRLGLSIAEIEQVRDTASRLVAALRDRS